MEKRSSQQNHNVIFLQYSKIVFTFLWSSRPENVPRLFDLVKAKDDKFLTAFYFALRDTLVAKDLDQATRIGLQVKCCGQHKKEISAPYHLFYLTLQLESSKHYCFLQLQGRTRYRVVTLDGQLIDIAGEQLTTGKQV